MLFDVSYVLIISKSQFDRLVAALECNLTINDSMYMCTYLLVNFVAWIAIVIIIKLIMFMFYQIFSRKKIFI